MLWQLTKLEHNPRKKCHLLLIFFSDCGRELNLFAPDLFIYLFFAKLKSHSSPPADVCNPSTHAAARLELQRISWSSSSLCYSFLLSARGGRGQRRAGPLSAHLSQRAHKEARALNKCRVAVQPGSEGWEETSCKLHLVQSSKFKLCCQCVCTAHAHPNTHWCLCNSCTCASRPLH